MREATNASDIAAVTEVAGAYYDGMMSGDTAKFAAAFHPRASIVGHEDTGQHKWRIDGLSFVGDKRSSRSAIGTRACGTRTISP